jgi:CubicO group peptidase (beta-lactamase class C family)
MIKILWRGLSLFLVCSILLIPSGLPATAQALDTSAVDAYINRVMQVMPIPGIAVSIVQGNQIVYQKGYGVAGPDGRPVTTQMPFLIGSVTKCYTAMGIMQLAGQGWVDLQAPVSAYIPEFHTLDPSISAQITLDLLINHKSGFSRADGGLDMLYRPDFTPADVLVYLAKINPANPVGKAEYSNLNFILLGIVIERVSGMLYADYIRKNVFEPLEMAHSHFSFEGANADNMAHTYRIMFGYPVPFDDIYSPAMQSAGYVYSSAEDLAHFLIPYFTSGTYGKTRVLEPLKTQTGGGDNGWFDIYWQWKSGSSSTRNLQGHEGGTNAANAAISYEVNAKTGVVVLTNTRVNAQAADASGAAVIARGLLEIATGNIPIPFDDGGFHDYYTQYNLTAAALLLAALLELAASLWFWPRWLKAKRLVPRLIFYLFFALDAVIALVILVGVPILIQYSWITIVQMRSDALLLELILGILMAGAALGKFFSLIHLRKRVKPLTTQNV